MRYFDTLDTANKVCLSRANKLLRCCGVDAEAERCNTFRQSGDDCVWWVFHYAEVEARMQHGEGGGACLSIGHGLRKQQIKDCLKRATEQLEAARAKWLVEVQKQLAQTEAVRMMVQKKMGNIAYIRRELDRLRQRAAVAAQEINKGTKDLADPEIFVENKKKISEARVQAMIDEAFKEIDELGRAEEAKQEEAKNAEQVKKKEKDQEEVKEQEKQKDEWKEFDEILEEDAVLEVLELEKEEVILRRFDVGFNKCV